MKNMQNKQVLLKLLVPFVGCTNNILVLSYA